MQSPSALTGPLETLDVMRALPHAIGCEKSVLSTLLNEPAEYFPIAEEEGITDDYFYMPAHRTLYRFMADQHAEGKDLELVGFTQKLLDNGMLDRVGGPSYLTDIYTYAPSGAHFRLHLGAVRDKYVSRSVVLLSNQAIQTAYDDPDDPHGLLDEVTVEIGRLRDTLVGSSTEVCMKELTKEFSDRYEKLFRNEVSPMGIETGIHEFDEALRGLHPSQVGIVSARSSGGKSTLASQMFGSIGGDGHNVAYFPFEGTIHDHFVRCVIQLARVPHEAVTDPGNRATTKHELEKIQQAVMTLNNGHFHFEQVRSRQISALVAAIHRCHRKHGINVAFIDYLQLIRSPRAKGDNGEREYADISHALQLLASNIKIAIVLLSQESDAGDTKYARAIEEDADWWLSIVQHRDKAKENYLQHRHILIAKDRHHGKGGTRLPLTLDKELVRFGYCIDESKAPPETRWKNS